MRNDKEFVHQLREEIISNQGNRATFIKLKLTFVVGLLGIGSISNDGNIHTAPLLYLVPLVAFIFDLYILGEDFGIKRAGRFIKTSPAASLEEQIWEDVLDQVRDWFSYLAGPLTTFVALVAAAIGIKISQTTLLTFEWWIAASGILIIFTLLSRYFRKRLLNKLEIIVSTLRLRKTDNTGELKK